MVVIPAIDILDGRCVRLVKGDYEKATIYSEVPEEVVAAFAKAGAEHLHVVDLDAARGTGDNRAVIRLMLRTTDVMFQVAGGVRDSDAVDAWLDGGADAVVMGTAAVRDPRLLERCAHKHPGRLLAALDIRDDKAAVTGWTETEPMMIGSLIARWDRLPLAGVVLTCIDRDGTLGGPDLKTLSRVRSMTSRSLTYSGGIATIEDLHAVSAAGAQAVILGKALYEGKITLQQALAT